jgi:hypothetical protein
MFSIKFANSLATHICGSWIDTCDFLVKAATATEDYFEIDILYFAR